MLVYCGIPRVRLRVTEHNVGVIQLGLALSRFGLGSADSPWSRLRWHTLHNLPRLFELDLLLVDVVRHWSLASCAIKLYLVSLVGQHHDRKVLVIIVLTN